jgi:hypothetical protein
VFKVAFPAVVGEAATPDRGVDVSPRGEGQTIFTDQALLQAVQAALVRRQRES